LNSNLIDVTAGDEFQFDGYVQWSGVAATGSAFELVVATFLQGAPVATSVVNAVSSPAASGSWTHLTGTYPVPASGVDQITLQIVVTSAATAGSAWFDDLSAVKTGLLSSLLVQGLTTGTLQADLTNLFSGFGSSSWTSFISDLSGVKSTATDAETAIGQIGQIVQGATVTPVSTAVSDVESWFANLVGFQDNTTATQQNLQNFTIATVTGGYRNPSWVCRYPIADVTYPEAMNVNLPTFGVTATASAGTAHTHAIDGNSVSAAGNYWEITPNAAIGGYLTVSNTTVYDTVGVGAYADSGTLNNVYLEIFREASDGSLTQLFSHEFSAGITTTAAYFEFTLPAGIIAQAGERYVVRVRNASTVATNVWVAGVEQYGWSVDASAAWIGATSANQTYYSAAAAATARAAITSLPWALLAAKNLATTDQSFSDNFSRAALGGLWVTESSTGTSQISISNNYAVYTGLANGTQNAIYIYPTAGDAMRVDADLAYTALALTGGRVGLPLCCNRDFSQMVYLSVGNTDARIYSGSAAAPTQRAVVSTTGNDGPWSIYYDPVANMFTALKNGVDIGLNWTDSGDVVAHGNGYRYGGLNISLLTLVSGGAVDNWTLRDWSA
jgi:hypothetical protein